MKSVPLSRASHAIERAPVRLAATRAAAPVAGPASTEARILDAAERCARRLGMQRFSMRDVATAASLSRGSVYRYFPDRERLVSAVLARAATRFVGESASRVRTRKTLVAQVSEAAVFIRERLHDDVLSLQLPSRSDTLFATLLTANLDGLVAGWIEFWQPYLADARKRGEIRRGIDPREAGEWIVRILLSLVVMPSPTLDLDRPDALRAFVARYIVRGLSPSLEKNA